MNIFVGIVADAGEWTVDVEAIKAAFAEACTSGGAEVFTAPPYVVKAYVKELRSYGLVAESRPAVAGACEDAWRKRDWKDLPPELKEAASASRAEAEVQEAGGTFRVTVLTSDHSSFDGSKVASAKFRAYVELAADAAKRFAPEEGILNACYARIRGPQGKAAVLESLSEEAAERAAAQLRSAGFVVETEREAAPREARSG